MTHFERRACVSSASPKTANLSRKTLEVTEAVPVTALPKGSVGMVLFRYAPWRGFGEQFRSALFFRFRDSLMDIDTKCPNCGKVFPINESFLGRRGRCADCRTVFVITEDLPYASKVGWWESIDKAVLRRRVKYGLIGIVVTYLACALCIGSTTYIRRNWAYLSFSGENVGTFLVCVLVMFAYLIPAIVASSRKHTNAPAIIILNLLLGWTFIGWAIALVWAFTATSNTITHIHKNE